VSLTADLRYDAGLIVFRIGGKHENVLAWHDHRVAASADNGCLVVTRCSEFEVEAMTKIEMFLLGMMVAWTPSLIFLAVVLWRAPPIDE